MKNFFTLYIFLFFIGTITAQQINFCDDFENYAAGDYIAQSSLNWETWSSVMAPCPTNPCTDDVIVTSNNPSTGTKSLNLNGGTAGGPADIILPFGLGIPYTTGNFELTTDIYVNTSAYLNIQAETVVGQGIGVWAIDIQMDDLGIITIDNGGGAVIFLTSTYPQSQWFEFKINIDLTQNIWEVYIDNQSIGNFSNPVNKISSLNLYPTIGNNYSIDNICYNYIPYIPLAYNMSATNLNIPSYIPLSSAPFIVSGDIVNLSSNVINSLDIYYSINGANPVVDNLIGLNLSLFDTLNFNHTINWNPTNTGTYLIEIWASNLNGNLDMDTLDDVFSKTVTVLTSIPEKITVGEEKTGSWCGWCPRGAVALAEMESTSSFIGIAIHNADPMAIAAYDGSINNYIPGGYPGGGVDRVLAGDPGDFSVMHASRVTEIVPCGVNSINASFDGATNKISVSTEVEFFGEMSGNYRLSCVIVEDDLESTASGWAQANYYSGGGSGNMTFPNNINSGYSFSGGPDPAQPSDFGGYDHVARSLSNDDILGDANSLPSGLINTGVYSYSFNDVSVTSLVAYNDAGFNWTKAHAVVMIVNATTGEILNAQEVALTSSNIASSWDCDGQNNCSDPGTGTGQYSSLSACEAVCYSTNIDEVISSFSVYPNPVKDVITINGIYESINILDIYGKIVLTSNNQKIIDLSELSNGIYMIEINTEKGTKIEKITVAK